MFRAIIFFDLDSTLVINPLGRRVMPKVYEEVSRILGVGVEKVLEIFTEKHMEKIRVGDPKAYDWDYILSEMLMENGIRPRENIFLEELQRVCGSVEVLDDAPRVLERLQNMGFYIVLSTNGFWKYQECVVREAGLLQYFKEISSPDKKGCLKSSSCFYTTSINGSIKISVGDNIIFDVYYPKKYGLRAIHVRRPISIGEEYARVLGIDLSKIEPDATVTSLAQIYGAIESILRGSNGDGRTG
ncbi:MAG TPA: HAD family hydrolase [Sulfolobales archaeon]|nr:HAD family hydrolase [Sulfolobales archaeon]